MTPKKEKDLPESKLPLRQTKDSQKTLLEKKNLAKKQEYIKINEPRRSKST